MTTRATSESTATAKHPLRQRRGARRLAGRVLDALHERSHRFIEATPFVGQRHRARRPLHETYAEALLQSCDRATHPGWREPERLRCAGEAPRLDDGAEHPDAVQDSTVEWHALAGSLPSRGPRFSPPSTRRPPAQPAPVISAAARPPIMIEGALVGAATIDGITEASSNAQPAWMWQIARTTSA